MFFITTIKNYFKSQATNTLLRPADDGEYRKHQNSIFWSATIGYGIFYICRTNISVIKPILISENVFNPQQLGTIGFIMFITYGAGKFVNGFLADHVNIARFISIGLLCSAILNLLLGNTANFYIFVLVWGLNGWMQATGAAPSVASLSQWFHRKEIGTRYGIWSTSHSIGEGFTFLVTSSIVVYMGWQWGFILPATICILASFVLSKTLRDRPQAYRLMPINSNEPEMLDIKKIFNKQKSLLKSPAIWFVACSSGMLYITRYGINSWAMVYLQFEKEFELLTAGQILFIYPFFGLAGAMSSGFISDKLFGSNRLLPVYFYSIIEFLALAIVYFAPRNNFVLHVIGFALFGFAMGALLVFLGGLIAVDFASSTSAGAAMGTVGVFSYVGAAIQDLISGIILEADKTQIKDMVSYNFDTAYIFWAMASVIAVIFVSIAYYIKSKGEVLRQNS